VNRRAAFGVDLSASVEQRSVIAIRPGVVVRPASLSFATILGLSALSLWAVSALAQDGGAPAPGADVPERRPGLWETTTTATGGSPQAAGPRTFKMRICTDASMEKRQSIAGGQMCSRRDVHRTATGWAWRSVCPMSPQAGAMSMTMDGTATGDLNSHYTSAVSMFSDDRAISRSMTSESTWLGPCPASMKPGDMIGPDGQTRNVFSRPQ